MGQRDLLFTKPDGCLPRTSELMKFLEDGADRLLRIPIEVNNDSGDVNNGSGRM
jgi:hypothetical protein